MTDKDIIKKIYIDLCTASINKDIDLINELLSDDYVLVHMTGKNQSKKEYIESLLNGDLKYYELAHESIEVKIEGEYATLVGKTKTLASPFGISPSWWKLRQDISLKKVNGKWIIILSKASMY